MLGVAGRLRGVAPAASPPCALLMPRAAAACHLLRPLPAAAAARGMGSSAQAAGRLASPLWAPHALLMRTARQARTRLFARKPRGSRRRPHSSSPEAVIFALVGVNTAVFAVWYLARDRALRYGDTGLYTFMMRNFTSGEQQLREGRWWTLLTYCVSQQHWWHLAFNMFTFVFTAPALLPAVGGTRLLQLYFGAGAFSALTSAVWPHVVGPMLPNQAAVRRRQYAVTQGASGSVFAIVAAIACAQPRMPFYLFYVVPIPAWLCVGGIAAWELHAASFPRPGSFTDSVGHVGGMLAGVLFWATCMA